MIIMYMGGYVSTRNVVMYTCVYRIMNLQKVFVFICIDLMLPGKLFQLFSVAKKMTRSSVESELICRGYKAQSVDTCYITKQKHFIQLNQPTRGDIRFEEVPVMCQPFFLAAVFEVSETGDVQVVPSEALISFAFGLEKLKLN